LTIAQRILPPHGGLVEVESELARGSCFSFSLPRAAPPAAAAD
jgi:signal transduction histidine kinase